MKLPLFANREEAVEIFKELGQEFAIVKNPSYIYPDFEFYPLAPKILTPRKKLVAVVKDMDGTTTTTEQLCLHSQEFMVGKITGMGKDPKWKGLDKKRDYPHIIGNSTTRHVEYLINTYGSQINPEDFKKSYMNAVLWFLAEGRDEKRMTEMTNNTVNLGWGGLLEEPEVLRLKEKGHFNPGNCGNVVEELLKKYGSRFNPQTLADKVRAAMEIYYQRYHEILAAIDRGEGEGLSQELLSEPGRKLIEPMPGVAVFLSLIKGWLGEDAVLFYEELKNHLLKNPHLNYKEEKLEKSKPRLNMLGRYFQNHPLKVGLVTSSIAYEANIVLKEVFNVICKQIERWTVSDSRKKDLINKFSDCRNFYDGFITASDSSEIRLKPHRDLYGIALHTMGIQREDFEYVIGFEDSESGTISIRAAGIGLCVAVPFSDTAGHNLQAAAYILHGGLPETILIKNLFLEL